MKTSIQIAIAAALLTAACGKATGTHYQGAPLLSVKGQMTLVKATAPADPIRLAIVWFPQGQTNLLSAPTAIVTSDVVYQGTFPLDYKFDLFAAPPASALLPLTIDGQTFNYGEGVLVAYEDLNGNGQLDGIPANGKPIDHILGTSIGDYYNGLAERNPIYIDYVEGTPPATWTGPPAGYSLLNYNLPQGQQVLPADSQVPLNLVDTNELDFLLCNSNCVIAPTGGVRIYGQMNVTNGSPSASVCLTTDGTTPLANSASASVQVNGQAISYVAADNCFESFDGTLGLNAPGKNVVDVALDGHAPWKFQVTLTGDFNLETPAFDQRALINSILPVRWSSASGAAWYQLVSYDANPPFTLNNDIVVYGFSSNCTMPGTPGTEIVSAQAYAVGAYAEGMGGSNLTGSVDQNNQVEVVAPETISLNASLAVVRSNGGPLSSWAYVQAFSGATKIGNATVAVDGSALTFSAVDGEYELISDTNFLTEGAANSVVVKRAGQADFSEQVQIPGDFDLTTPPPQSALTGSTMSLAWTESTGASGYQVLIYGQAALPLVSVYTNDLAATFQLPEQAGPYFLYVMSYGDITNPDLFGQVENAFNLTLE